VRQSPRHRPQVVYCTCIHQPQRALLASTHSEGVRGTQATRDLEKVSLLTYLEVLLFTGRRSMQASSVVLPCCMLRPADFQQLLAALRVTMKTLIDVQVAVKHGGRSMVIRLVMCNRLFCSRCRRPCVHACQACQLPRAGGFEALS
jgi:hypothetical protein